MARSVDCCHKYAVCVCVCVCVCVSCVVTVNLKSINKTGNLKTNNACIDVARRVILL